MNHVLFLQKDIEVGVHCGQSFLFFCIVQYEDISENDKRVKFLWKALENFTNGKNLMYVLGGCKHTMMLLVLVSHGRESRRIQTKRARKELELSGK